MLARVKAVDLSPSYAPEALAERVAWLSEVCGYSFVERGLAVAAMAHEEARLLPEVKAALAGCWFEQNRLAWLGDAALTLIATSMAAGEPTMKACSRAREALVSNKALAEKARNHGLGSRVLCCPNYCLARSDTPLATALEAVLGAVYQDSGCRLPAVRAAAERLGIIPSSLAPVSHRR